MELNDKTWFDPGDVVQLKQDLDYKPKMIVKGKDQKMIRKETITSRLNNETVVDKKGVLKGMICFWFTIDGLYQEAVFSTKDLQKVK